MTTRSCGPSAVRALRTTARPATWGHGRRPSLRSGRQASLTGRACSLSAAKPRYRRTRARDEDAILNDASQASRRAGSPRLAPRAHAAPTGTAACGFEALGGEPLWSVPRAEIVLHHAGCFADVIHGARIRYAGFVAEAREDEALAEWVKKEEFSWTGQFTGSRGRQLARGARTCRLLASCSCRQSKHRAGDGIRRAMDGGGARRPSRGAGVTTHRSSRDRSGAEGEGGEKGTIDSRWRRRSRRRRSPTGALELPVGPGSADSERHPRGIGAVTLLAPGERELLLDALYPDQGSCSTVRLAPPSRSI